MMMFQEVEGLVNDMIRMVENKEEHGHEKSGVKIEDSKLLPLDNLKSPTLCIPRVSTSVNRKMVEAVFNKTRIGKVAKVDIVTRNNLKTMETYNQVFIHFKRWNVDDVRVKAIRDKLMSGGSLKVVYDLPWFWKCSASRFH
jgi:hypothetical protein